VHRRGRIVAGHHAGANDVELGVAVRADTPFQIASVSKMFTSVGIMLLADDGKLRLDTPVTELLGDAPAAWSAIRIHHLLSHTSGLPGNIAANAAYAAEERTRRDRSRFVDEAKLDLFTTRERLAYLAELPLQAAPGARWSYNQPGYIMLGAIVEQLTGRPFATYMRERIFAALGMTTATYGDSRVVVAGRRQVAYTRQYGPLQNWIWPYATSDYPAAGLNASAGDVAKLFVALDQGLLRSETRDAMWTEVTPADGTPSHYALGWTVESVGGRTVVGHEGGGCAWASHLPAERTTAIVLTNLAGSGADLGNKLVGLYV
jgi:CubicO group peptidase (beta-lactamase class C family)